MHCADKTNFAFLSQNRGGGAAQYQDLNLSKLLNFHFLALTLREDRKLDFVQADLFLLLWTTTAILFIQVFYYCGARVLSAYL